MIFMDLTLEQRIDYMLYWCDPEKREEGFRKADAILLELFERFNLEKEMNIDFTDRNEFYWREFCRSKRKKDRNSWNKYEWRFFLRTCNNIDLCSGLSMTDIGQTGNIDRLTDDGKYRLGACIYIPHGLNFGKQLLEDFKTSKLFQGTDLENCRKGIKMLRDLMIDTAETMKNRLPKLLGEHAALMADSEDKGIKEAQMLEVVGKNSRYQYDSSYEDRALADCDSQSLIKEEGITTDSDHDASEPRYPPVAKMNHSEYKENTASSIWTFDEGDTTDSFSNTSDDDSVSELSVGATEDLIEGDNILLQQHMQHQATKSLSGVAAASTVVSRSDPSQVSLLKQLPIDDFLFKHGKGNQPPHTVSFAQPSSPQHRNAHATTAVSRSDPCHVSLLKQLPIDDFLIKHGKRKQPFQTASFTQPSPSPRHDSVFSHSASKMTTVKYGRQEQAEVSLGEAATLDDDNDFAPSRVTSKNDPIAKKTPIKKRRH
ncbi:hypothetical protein BGZ70_000790 [Mortierella alpina]|uniref:Uncharacterized protein n=1 Tax=Mortierella alpina TaxID=64518 RepID=A0A9P6IXQ6_MORAP|nr:hypothetical protein BGZ70_000790 [Mortierella alpina]